jgi:hypothetical protein
MSPHESSYLQLICVVTCVLIGTSAKSSIAQQADFDQLLIGVSASESISKNPLTKRWDPSTGIKFSVQTPFLSGRLEGGIRYMRFDNSNNYPTYSDFHSTYIHLGWGYLLKLSSAFKLGPVLRIGNHHLYYDEAMTYQRPNGFEYRFDDNESEFAYEISLISEYNITKNWRLQADLAYNRTLTYHPLQQTLVSIGLAYSFDTSSWLKDFLK